MIPALGAAATFLAAAMSVAWILQRRTGNSGWIDTVWSFSVGIASLIGLALLPVPSDRRWLLAGLVVLWSARLGGHILIRTGRISDDPRYASLMATWGPAAPLRLFLFLQVQALAGIVLVLAVLLAASAPAPALGVPTLALAVLAVVAGAGEALADAQLSAFRRERPPGGVCDTGLWSISRHPNYFFEWLFWLAIAALALAPPAGWHAALALAAPLMMYALLRHGSGVPHLEAHMQRTRPGAFSRYAARVPVFFPWTRP